MRRGLTLDKAQAVELVFSAGGEEVFSNNLGGREELDAGTAVDLNPEKKTLDFMCLSLLRTAAGKEVFTVEMEINAEKSVIKSSPLPLKSCCLLYLLNVLKPFIANCGGSMQLIWNGELC